MESDRIILEDHSNGFDPGIAALMQNACKGNLDPTAMMAMMNNGNFGGNGSW